MTQWVKSVTFGVPADVRFYPESDRDCVAAERRFVPLATKVLVQQNRLFDHLVGASEQPGRHDEVEHRGGLGIDD